MSEWGVKSHLLGMFDLFSGPSWTEEHPCHCSPTAPVWQHRAQGEGSSRRRLPTAAQTEQRSQLLPPTWESLFLFRVFLSGITHPTLILSRNGVSPLPRTVHEGLHCLPGPLCTHLYKGLEGCSRGALLAPTSQDSLPGSFPFSKQSWLCALQACRPPKGWSGFPVAVS